MADRYRRPADLPQAVPLFPLRGALLLPRADLPLNIFEPRYLAMIDDTMAGDRVIGIIQPAGNSDDEESPEGSETELRKVGCVGRVTSYQEMDDGRIVITLTGIARFDLQAEANTGDPYRTGDVIYDRFEGDLVPGVGEDEVDRDYLLTVLRSYLEANKLKADWESITTASSEFLINALAVMSPYGSEEKQALLEAEDLKTRAEVLIALAQMELAAGSGSGGTIQ